MPETHPYAAERFNPKVPMCAKSRISLTFNGNFLTMTGGNMPGVFTAVSGKKQHGNIHFLYSPDVQKLRNQGPIPAGIYWVSPAELWERPFYDIVTSQDGWGNYRLTIHPYPSTQTYGRGGFFIHGGKNPGSAGCIDLWSSADRFFEQLKKELGGNYDCYIQLTVRY